MPPPKTYNYTTNDVSIVEGNSRVFLDFRDSTGKFVPSFRENNIGYRSYANKKFQQAKQRCNPECKAFRGAEFHFLEFQDFADWITKEKFYGYPNYELDKDLFYDGEILRYSKETCCLIPASLNSIIVNKKVGASGIIGAGFNTYHDKYRCVVTYKLFGGETKDKFIGYFKDVEECHERYIYEKMNVIRGVVAESYKDHVDVKVYEKLKHWKPRK